MIVPRESREGHSCAKWLERAQAVSLGLRLPAQLITSVHTVAPGDFRGSRVAGLWAEGYRVLGPHPGLGAPRGDKAHWQDEVTSCRAASGPES